MPPAPTAAETMRSALIRPGRATLAADSTAPVRPVLQHPWQSGSIAVLLHGSTPASDTPQPGTTSVLEVVDRLLHDDEPVRTITWLAGTVEHADDDAQRRIAVDIAEARPHEALLDVGHTARLVLLRPTACALADAHGVAAVTPLDLADARADPFCLTEEAWIAHFEQSHAAILDALARRLPAKLRTRPARPIALDRHGITLRTGSGTGAGAVTDARIPFDRTARDPVELGRALRTLAQCPHPPGIRTAR